MELFDLQPDQRLVSVERERNSKGFVYACLDVRKELIIVSQRIVHIQRAIEALCNHSPSVTSLFESAARRHKGGRTAGAWSVVQLQSWQVVTFVDEHRVKYKRTVIACDNPRKWTLDPVSIQALC